jgi:hypothetical protein
VDSVDPANRRISVSLRGGMGGPAKKMDVSLSEKAVVRRYAPDSVKFSDARIASLGDIAAGDQVRARGEKSADGASMTAEEIVGGTFRNVAAQIVKVDPAEGRLTVTDLDTKKPLVVKVTPDSSLRKVPEMMARFLAMRLNAGEGGMPGMPSGGGPGAGLMRPGGAGGPGGGGPGGGGMGGPGMMGPGGPGGGGPPSPAQMLERMPAFKLDELKPGDALIIASTAGKSEAEATAITVLAGVEPMLTAPSQNRQAMLGSWNLDMNMGGGGMGTP